MNEGLNRLGAMWVGLGLASTAMLAWAWEADILAFSLAFAFLASLPLLERGDRHALDPFRPLLGLSVLLFLYSLSTLLYVSEEGLTYYGESVSEGTVLTYQLACLLCMAGIGAGTLLIGPRRFDRVAPAAVDEAAERAFTYRLGALLGLVMLPFIHAKFQPWNATAYADAALALRVDNLADQAAGIKETVLENIPTALVLAAGTLASFDRSLRLHERALGATLVVLYISTALLSGWRGHMMFAALTVAVYFHWKVRRLKILPLAAAGVITYVLINALSVARVSADPVEMVIALSENFGEKGLGFLALKQSGELATSTNLLRLISGLEGGETSFGMGSIALGQLMAFVPRAILPDRPPVASELFVQTFYPGIFESGGGYGFFLPQDGYWDFGLLGVFFYGIALGACLEALFRWFLARRHSAMLVLLYAAVYSQLVLSVVRSGFLGSVKASLLAAAPALLLLGLFALTRRPTQPHVPQKA